MTQFHEMREKTTSEWTLVRTVCNGCGKDCDRLEDAQHIERMGYNSRWLDDYTTYSFDLCEACLCRVMDGLKIPPKVVAHVRRG